MTDTKLPFQIDWSSRSKMRGPGEQSLGKLLHSLRDRLAPGAQGVSLTYVDDRGMRKLNREHRGKNMTTDVLSFPSSAEKGAFPHLGDIVISLPTAEKMAKKFGVSRRREVETLVIHGFLHLCGHDHEKDQGEMMALQAQLERDLLETEPLSMSLKRGRKPGSKVKKLKDGTRVVVTGRAAAALVRRERVKKEKKVKVRKVAKPKEAIAKRGPGRPRKEAAAAPAKRVLRRRRPTPSRSGVIA
ncbi:MAG TPA: rRNA maturation RNase YbeY [Geothrix sp.]|uniref:rRNA maturation RNase YbeY n=1 Tax=Geothrix mesophila TaxID=2922723 RepID=UPI001FAB70C3|nr:rRNA maturation RNase YbeY [Geothrix sp. SG198]HJV37206.1 rRNA maturation RNase YbeY [Geothrix sp.]